MIRAMDIHNGRGKKIDDCYIGLDHYEIRGFLDTQECYLTHTVNEGTSVEYVVPDMVGTYNECKSAMEDKWAEHRLNTMW